MLRRQVLWWFFEESCICWLEGHTVCKISEMQNWWSMLPMLLGECWGSAGEECMYNKQLDGKTRHSRHSETSWVLWIAKKFIRRGRLLIHQISMTLWFGNVEPFYLWDAAGNYFHCIPVIKLGQGMYDPTTSWGAHVQRWCQLQGNSSLEGICVAIRTKIALCGDSGT
jgi:hypothetical protein